MYKSDTTLWPGHYNVTMPWPQQANGLCMWLSGTAIGCTYIWPTTHAHVITIKKMTCTPFMGSEIVFQVYAKEIFLVLPTQTGDLISIFGCKIFPVSSVLY